MEKARDLESLGGVIKYNRLKRNLTQHDLAIMAKTTQMTVYKIENGMGGTLKVLMQLLRAMNLEIVINQKMQINSKNIADFLE